MIRLIVNRWNEPHPVRRAELELCARKNADNPHIEVVVLEAQARLSYQALFDAANARLASTDDISVIANADMYFDDTIVLAAALGPTDAYALSRYDVRADGTAQLIDSLGIDAWLFRGLIEGIKAAFPLGSWATDVRLNAEIVAAGYRLYNPAKTIKSYHVHASNIRNYRQICMYPGQEVTIPPHALTHRPVPLLDILICTLDSRRAMFDTLHAKLTRQIADAGLHGRVGIRFLRDQKQMTVGEKRNRLVLASDAEYTCFVDDDDDVSDDYVPMLVRSLDARPDCVGLVGIITVRGAEPRTFVHSLKYDRYDERDGVYYRPPNHLNPIRRSMSARIPFPEKSNGEDWTWAMAMRDSGMLRTEAPVDRPYYFYRFDPERTETQR